MNARRGFLALVGGSLFTGAVTRVQAANSPQLILPAASMLPSATSLLNEHDSEMCALLHIKQRMPQSAFRDWMEGGLRQAKMFKDSDSKAENERIRAAVQRYGSIIQAIRAGAI